MRATLKTLTTRARAKARGALTTLAELAGLAAISAGCWRIYEPAGLIAAGIGLVLIGMVQA